ncbi:hypothetical protein ABZP36_016682 [Zizania latifolia]
MARAVDAACGEAEAAPDDAASTVAAALGAVGLATTSTAITLAATYQPPPGGHGDHTCVPLALSGLAFFTGIAQVGASVWVSADTRGRRAAGYNILYASVCAVGLTVASLLISS